jgi:IS30 family transposase
MSYTHITKNQRVELGALLRAKTSKKDLALLLGKNRANIWRELRFQIDQRPVVVEEKSRIGDWEGYTIWGKEQSIKILALVERKSGLLKAKKIETNTDAEVRVKKEIFKQFRTSEKHTLTFDNGAEFSDYEYIQKDTGLERDTNTKHRFSCSRDVALWIRAQAALSSSPLRCIPVFINLVRISITFCWAALNSGESFFI